MALLRNPNLDSEYFVNLNKYLLSRASSCICSLIIRLKYVSLTKIEAKKNIKRQRERQARFLNKVGLLVIS